MKALRVTMPDGSMWEVPLEAIAEHRADYFAARRSGNRMSLIQQAMKKPGILKEWAQNEMDWDHVKSVAVQVKRPDHESMLQEGWVNGHAVIVDGQVLG